MKLMILLSFYLNTQSWAPIVPPKVSLPSNQNLHRVIANGETITEPKDCIEEEMRKRTLMLHINGSICSGVLIDGNTIALAGHCGSQAGNSPSRKIEKGSKAAGLTKAYYYDQAEGQYKEAPLPKAASSQFEGDIASGKVAPGQKDMLVMRLSKAIPGIKPIRRTPVEEMRTLQTMDLYVAGFGLNEKNQVSRELKYLWAQGRVKPNDSHVSINPQFEKDRVRKGDSGGPVFRVVGDCEVELAGITKGVDENPGSKGLSISDSAEDIEQHIADLNHSLKPKSPAAGKAPKASDWKTTVSKPARK